METNQERTGLLGHPLLQNPLIVAGAAFLLGLIIGLVLLGWWLFPVQWENATPEHLRADLQEDYMRMVIDSYNLHQDIDLAQQRVAELGDQAPNVLATVAADPGDQSTEAISVFQFNLEQGGTVVPELTPDAGDEDDAAAGRPTGTSTLLLVACVFTLLLGGAAGVVFFIRRRQQSGESWLPGGAEEDYDYPSEVTDYEVVGQAPPLAQWMTTFNLGDNLYDDSFSIDSPQGEFLGECGVGIADTIGVGEPKRVSAFEVWLFDKNDIQTVTKVLMSAHAFNDSTARERLIAKGEPIQAEVGREIVLETATLQLVARVVDMTYGKGALPDESFFEYVAVEMAVWAK